MTPDFSPNDKFLDRTLRKIRILSNNYQLSLQKLNVCARKMNTHPPRKRPGKPSTEEVMRTIFSGLLLGLVGSHVEGAYRGGHVRVNQGGSARENPPRLGLVYKLHALVRPHIEKCPV